jgi:hypothetical protein
MVPKPLKTPSKAAFSAYLSMIRKSMPSGSDPMGGNRFSEKIMLKQKGNPSNLDAWDLSPYTSAVPGNGRDFGPPRAARAMRFERRGWKRILSNVAAL